jgi:hypothetical protein
MPLRKINAICFTGIAVSVNLITGKFVYILLKPADEAEE